MIQGDSKQGWASKSMCEYEYDLEYSEFQNSEYEYNEFQNGEFEYEYRYIDCEYKYSTSTLYFHNCSTSTPNFKVTSTQKNEYEYSFMWASLNLENYFKNLLIIPDISTVRPILRHVPLIEICEYEYEYVLKNGEYKRVRTRKNREYEYKYEHMGREY